MKEKENAAIGIFDSGVGGLTVTREIMLQMPQERLVYFGDTARVPYGTKSRDTIIRYSRQNIRFLLQQNVKAIVVACNTASAFVEEVQKDFAIPIIGVVRPGAKAALANTRNGRVGIIATQATIRSRIYERVIHESHPEIQVFGKACPLFVPLVEEGWMDDPVTEEVVRRYLKELQEKEIDTLILGCTHYPLLRGLIGKVLGPDIRLVNPAHETALELKRLLEKEDRKRTGDGTPAHDFYVSDAAENFRHFAQSILPCDITKTREIAIEEF
jgi:glutamate racemase